MTSRPIDAVLSRLEKVQKTRGGWTARCPSHEDRTPSLSVTEASDSTVLLHCWAGCSTERVLAALDLSWHDLFPQQPRRRGRT